MTSAVWVVVAFAAVVLVAVGALVASRVRRLDRLHVRTDAARDHLLDEFVINLLSHDAVHKDACPCIDGRLGSSQGSDMNGEANAKGEPAVECEVKCMMGKAEKGHPADK